MIYQAYNLSPSQEICDFSIPEATRDSSVTSATKGTRLVVENSGIFFDSDNFQAITVKQGVTGYYYYKASNQTYYYLVYLDGTQEEGTYYKLKEGMIQRYVPKKLPDEYDSGVTYFYNSGYYETPFSFYLNGTSNLQGLRLQIYENKTNTLLYDTGVISESNIALEESRDLVTYTLTPFTGAQAIDLPTAGSKGQSVKVELNLPIAPQVESFVNKIVNTPETGLYWVLTQYYERNSLGEVDETKYVINSPVFFYAMQKPYIGLRYFHRESDGTIKWIDDLTNLGNYGYRDIWVKGEICYNTKEMGDSEYTVGNYFNYSIYSADWTIKPYVNGVLEENEIITETINTATLLYHYTQLKTSRDNKTYSYKIEVSPYFSPEINKQTDNLTLETGMMSTGEPYRVYIGKIITSVAPDYETTNLEKYLDFKAEVCNNKGYVELTWENAFHLGTYYENDTIIRGNAITPYLLNFGEYNAGKGTVKRTLTSIYIPKGNKLVYDDLGATEDNQIYLRFCNLDNIIGDFCTITKEDGTTIKLSFVKSGALTFLNVSRGEESQLLSIRTTWQTWLTITINLNSGVGIDALVTPLNYGVSSNGANLLSENARISRLFPSISWDESDSYIGNPNGSQQTNGEGVSLKSYKTDTDAKYGRYLENITTSASVTTISIPSYPQEVFVNDIGDTGVKLPTTQLTTGITDFLLLKDYTEGDTTLAKGVYSWNGTEYAFKDATEGNLKVVFRQVQQEDGTWATREDYYMLVKNAPEYTRLSDLYYYPGTLMVKDSAAGWGIETESGTIDDLPEIITGSADTIPYTSITFQNCVLDYAIIGNLGSDGSSTSAEWKKKFTTFLKTALLPIYKVEENNTIIAKGEPSREVLGDVDFLANYSENISGGEVKLGKENIENWQINEVDFKGDRREVAFLPLEVGSFRDYSIPNNWKGYYEITPISGNYIGDTITYPGSEDSLTTNWWKYALLVLGDEDENGNREVETTFYWNLNASTGDISNNTTFNVQETLARFKRISKSQTNAISGSLQSLVGYMENGEYHGDTIEVINKLYEIQMSNKVKVLKDRNGRNYVIEFTSPITFTQDSNSCVNTTYTYDGYSKPVSIQPSTIKINWIEVGKFENIKAIEIL